MANKQHVSITDPDIHEPKGVSSALANLAYVSNGSGSGVWKKIDLAALKGLTGDGGVANLKLLSDGTGGVKAVTDTVYGSMVMNANTNAFTTTAATDATLNTNTDYTLLTGTGAPWQAGSLMFGTAFSTDRLTVATTGVYRLDLWATISGYPANNAKISAKYRINGATFSQRHPLSRSTAAGDVGSLSGFGLLSLNAGDYVQIYIASTAAGPLILSDVNSTLQLVRAT